jgi:hypothetical protein
MEPPGCRVQGMEERRRLCWSPDHVVPKIVWTALFGGLSDYIGFVQQCFDPGEIGLLLNSAIPALPDWNALIRIPNR